MSNTKVTIPIQPDLINTNKINHCNLQILYAELVSAQDPQKVQELITLVFNHMKEVRGLAFEASLQFLLRIFHKGYATQLTQESELTRKIMDYFVELNCLFRKQQTEDLQYRIFFVLSILAQFVRQQPKYVLPFTHKFLQNMFQIQVQELTNSGDKAKLLAILSVLFSNLTKQCRLIKELKVEKLFKQAILANFSQIEQLFTLKLFNQCIILLQTKKVIQFTLCQLQRYHIKETILKTIPERQADIVVKFIDQLFPRSHKDKIANQK